MDKYWRTIGDVQLPDGTNINQQLMKEGWCWWYQKHTPKDLAVQQAEREAKEAKRGLWTDPVLGISASRSPTQFDGPITVSVAAKEGEAE